ncbi:MAG: carboxyl-terminal processing protease [Acidobacteriota bacterium]|nr:carboxyl-terminal processing protease [Acidobacteriota bacterium]
MRRELKSPRCASAFALTFCVLVSCLVVFSLLPARSYADANVSTETREGRLAVFDDVWATLGARYYDPKMRGVDWLQQRATFRPLAEEAHTSAEFYTTLRRMIAPLRDAHTRVYAPDERSEWDRPIYTGVRLSLREIAGQLVVTLVEHGSQAERAGARVGDELLSIDGQPVNIALTHRADEGSSASTARASRLSAIAHLFDGPRGSLVSLNLAREGVRGRTVVLTRELETREPRLEVRRIGDVSVVRFNLFSEEIAAGLVRALRERKSLREASALVIDLRENGGGEAESMIDIASIFLPAGARLGEFTDRDGRLVASPQARRAMLFAAEEIEPFHGRIVVLTSARTASAAEIFVASLKDAGLARVVGEQTCGCVLAIRTRHQLPDGGLLDVSEMDYRTARGTRLEGAGIAPDETITPTRRDVEQARDPALLHAIAILKTMKSARQTMK